MFVIEYIDLAPSARPHDKAPSYIGTKNSFQLFPEWRNEAVRLFATANEARAYIIEHRRVGHYFGSQFSHVSVVAVADLADVEKANPGE